MTLVPMTMEGNDNPPWIRESYTVKPESASVLLTSFYGCLMSTGTFCSRNTLARGASIKV